MGLMTISDFGLQLQKERLLVLDDLCHRAGHGEVCDTINLRKVLAPPRSRRPLHRKDVAGERL